MRIGLFLVSLIAVFVLPSQDLRANGLDPDFATQLEQAEPDQFVTGMVGMREKVDIRQLKLSVLFPKRLSAAERHEKVVRTMQETASRTQKSLIENLEEEIEAGRVEKYTNFWITNAVAVTAIPQVFYEIAARPDVGTIYGMAGVELIEPVAEKPAVPAGRGIEPGILSTNAPMLWFNGIKGQGTIVCNIDTGVDGNHSALASRWQGLQPGVTPSAAWFDPVTYTTFPQDFNGHGTHTMGTICGDDGGSNQVGMAPEARWIAAATIDRVSIEQTKIDAVLSFEWCADPDGNPSTYDDVPCVASNSWRLSPLFHGVSHGDPYFWDAIDGCEAAGCAVVFAAGNEGYYGGTTIGTPSDRITSPVNVLSVGSLDTDQTTRSDFSSMGPSGIDNFTKKPEVMAHGDEVRSSTVGGGYGYKSGTSMACPHVAGAISLLKSAHPEATPSELKAALLYTATDQGPAGEDNEYGRGRINMVAANSFLNQSLVADTMELSLTSEQQEVIFSLHAGAAYAGRKYITLGSLSGSSPGTTLPGGLVIPLNKDILTKLTIIYTNTLNFQNFSGYLDGGGNGTALLDVERTIEDPVFIGTIVTFVFITLPPPGFDFASNAWDIEITQ